MLPVPLSGWSHHTPTAMAGMTGTGNIMPVTHAIERVHSGILSRTQPEEFSVASLRLEVFEFSRMVNVSTVRLSRRRGASSQSFVFARGIVASASVDAQLRLRDRLRNASAVTRAR